MDFEMAAKVLVSDKLSEAGIEVMRSGGLAVDNKPGISPEELLAIIPEYDALVVRSRTKVKPEVFAAATNLKLVGRAGVGVDNIDRDAAIRHGVIVMNTPGISSTTVAEHAFGMMLAMARHLAVATSTMKSGLWEKKRLQGRQLSGMTLGVVGIGNIGSILVNRAISFGMNVVAYDPFVTPEAASDLGAELVELDALWGRADIISLHIPHTDQTHHIVNRETLAQMKQGSYLVNCARGGVVDEVALAEALETGHLAGAAMDVFEQEPPGSENPLLQLESFVCAPHLGASTLEAQDGVAIALAEQMIAYFDTGAIRNAVNVASVSTELLEQLGPWLLLGRRIGSLAGQLASPNLTEATVTFAGDIPKEGWTSLTSEVLTGILGHFLADPVNTVNAEAFAKQRGLTTQQVDGDGSSDFPSTIGVKLVGSDGEIQVFGTVLGKGELRIVGIDEFKLDAVPSGHLLVIRNDDVPGIVGSLGTILGEAGINIGSIHLSRIETRGEACSIIKLDAPAPADLLSRLRAAPHITNVAPVKL